MSQDRQLELFTDRPVADRASLHHYLARGLTRPLTLSLTRNRVSMLDYRRKPDGSVTLRLHRHFVDAPMPVLATLHRYLRSRRSSDWRELSLYVQTVPPRDVPGRPRSLNPRGKVYDLEAIRNRINATYFDNQVDCAIGWGKQRRVIGRDRRSIRYGSCDIAQQLIRLHPLLDQVKVPAHFVDYIVFHEMLHLVIPPRRTGQVWQQHPPDFRRAEKQFPRYHDMRRMAHDLLTELDS